MDGVSIEVNIYCLFVVMSALLYTEKKVLFAKSEIKFESLIMTDGIVINSP